MWKLIGPAVSGLLQVAAGGDGIGDTVVSCSDDVTIVRRRINGFCHPVSGIQRGTSVLQWS